MQFSHLHCHSQFSLLDGAASLEGMIAKAAQDKQRAVALTDHGNMFGAFKFVQLAKQNNVIPIVGCEFYMVEDRFRKKFSKAEGDKRYHQLLLAKNQEGYKNISKLCSLGYIEGLYSKWPRIDKEILRKHKEGLIATTCCIGAEIPQTILTKGEEAAEKLFLEWLDLFGEDYYIELQRHQIKNIDGTGYSQEDLNQILLKWGEKYNVKVIATNDSHYVEQNDFETHDILLCVNTGSFISEPKGRGKGFRFGFPNDEFYFKTKDEMEALFGDVPFALDNTNLIVDKIEVPELARDVLLPAYTLPEGFRDQDDYLKHLTFEGARRKYKEITSEVEERINFELETIKNTGYPGYFLIVQDFMKAAIDLDVAVGPGRGSAAGSVVAYCNNITNVDPLKYNLLFERFLNPDRVSLPDIDIDFDDEGRDRVINYVVEKYGKNQVAQIITYGSMAARSAMRDVGRVTQVPLNEVNEVLKQFPDHLSASLKGVLAEGGVSPKLKEKLSTDLLAQANSFREIAAHGKPEHQKMIAHANKLEGTIRNTGVHACGVIIAPENLMNLIPLTVGKDEELLLTQFDNSVVEDAGLLKMDFLGLKNLSIIKEAVKLVKANYDIDIDINNIPLDDEKTYKLFQRAETKGIFQFEGDGMRKSLKDLKPNQFEDLIAMNALYRPGPMDYIPNYIKRKNGTEKVTYDLPDMEEYLAETYGITVYQEQVMLLSQKLADFSKGEADTLRKAMGKKKKKLIDEMWPKFLEGCKKHGHDEKVVLKIWKDWEKFASYAFNKSHSTCYALIAYQSAYLKANYPEEFMAAILTKSMSNNDRTAFFMDECKKMKIEVIPPNINQSNKRFRVVEKGKIAFGLAAIKGVGSSAMAAIVKERDENGTYSSIFDLARRLPASEVGKKSYENLALAGAFDCFENIHRAQYFTPDEKGEIGIERAIRFSRDFYANSILNQASLFAETELPDIKMPELPEAEEWTLIEKLQKEKKVIGLYLSGHPLNDYKLEIKSFANSSISKVETNYDGIKKFAAIVSSVREFQTKKGDSYGRFVLEDFENNIEVTLFSKDYAKYKTMLELNAKVLIKAKHELRWNSETEYMLKILDVEFLEDLTKKVRNIQLDIPIDLIDEAFNKEFEKLVKDNPGTCFLSVCLVHPEKGYKVDLISNSVQINPSDEIFSWIEDKIAIDFKFA